MPENNQYQPNNFKLLFTSDRIQKAIKLLAIELDRNYIENAKDICFIGILNGSVFFLTDLMMRLNFTAELDFIQVSSYGSDTKSSGNVTLNSIEHLDLDNKHVIIVDDIIDTGLTLQTIKTKIQKAYNPKSIKTCVLIKKHGREQVNVKIDYYCFEIDDKFVVGYGFDFEKQYRNLNEIYYLDN